MMIAYSEFSSYDAMMHGLWLAHSNWLVSARGHPHLCYRRPCPEFFAHLSDVDHNEASHRIDGDVMGHLVRRAGHQVCLDRKATLNLGHRSCRGCCSEQHSTKPC